MSKRERELREDLKKEYLRGIKEAEELHKGCKHEFLGLMRDKLSQVIDNAIVLEDAEDGIEDVIRLIDEYMQGNTTVKELKEVELGETVESGIKIEGDEVISLIEFVRD